mmetsp:Transcript_82424/g.207406  ORF Transcript_82424/g.207406 Transcript_82424/m.207406 type:complete len:200 (+) Transcript_82424:304-903(+)
MVIVYETCTVPFERRRGEPPKRRLTTSKVTSMKLSCTPAICATDAFAAACISGSSTNVAGSETDIATFPVTIVGAGAGVGAGINAGVGADVGSGVDEGVGAGVAAGVGADVGAGVGAGVGLDVGTSVGAGVGTSVYSLQTPILSLQHDGAIKSARAPFVNPQNPVSAHVCALGSKCGSSNAAVWAHVTLSSPGKIASGV